jgi:cyclopropane-fatty-acyl-phospholipid synthase
MTISTAIKWPATAPRAPLRATIARVIFEHAVRRVPVRVTYPDGRVLGGGSPTSPEFKLFRPSAFFTRLGRDAKVGFGESYMAGDWRAGSGTDLADLLTPFAARLATLVPAPLRKLRALADKRVPRDRENTPDGARSNIAAHYDLSNDLFACFLDPTMTYSAAWFDESEPVQTATRLEEAQLRKIDEILDLAGVRDGTRLLEIGTGWGTLAIRAAQRGAQVTTVTLSREQLALVSERRVGSRGRATAGLPRDRRRVRRHRQRRDDRGGRRGLLGYLLRHPRPPSGARREGEHPGNHHGSRPAPRHPAKFQLDSEVHLPRRDHPVLAGDR